MKKVAVLGNTGGGKSTLAKALSVRTGLPLHALDKLCWRPGGGAVPAEEFRTAHDNLLMQDSWVIEGYGSLDTLWPRLAAADTLVYVDLPLALHGWWVTKRLLKGLFVAPEGWPDNSPLWNSTLSSYKVLWLCHRRLTPKYRAHLLAAASSKTCVHLRSPRQIARFLDSLSNQADSGRKAGSP